MKTAAIHTLGCKVNTYDSEAIMEILQSQGYEIVSFDERADVYIVNTCTVTNLGDRKSRQMIRRAKRTNEEAIVVVCGCYAQTASNELESIPEVDLILGNDDRHKIVEYIDKVINEGHQINAVKNIMALKEYEELTISDVKDRERGFIKIQEGCDQFCAYCIIPYARGPVRSRKMENILSEAEKMAVNGNKELVLTGINISAFGKDSKEGTLQELILRLNQIEGLKRIRISSLEPNLLTEEFLKEIAAAEKICDHFHVSMQSGAKEVLKNMKRRYTKEDYMQVIGSVRKYFPNASITTDVMVGFPGETDEDFNETVDYIKKIRFSKLHVFKYSKRAGTPAADYENQVPDRTKEKRSSLLIALSEELEKEYAGEFIGKEAEILIEKKIKTLENHYSGHTKNYLNVTIESDEDITSEIVSIKIQKLEDGHLSGILIK